jgi:transcriptional antiterminator Rof (Rho-off)
MIHHCDSHRLLPHSDTSSGVTLEQRTDKVISTTKKVMLICAHKRTTLEQRTDKVISITKKVMLICAHKFISKDRPVIVITKKRKGEKEKGKH